MKKLLFVVVLIFCLLGTTEIAYAYIEQDQIQVLNEDGDIYKIIETSSDTNKSLVPTGAVLGQNDSYELVFTYQVYVEKGVDLESAITDIKMEKAELNPSDLSKLYNFDIKVDHVKDVKLSNGILEERTIGELIQITIRVSMNNLEDFNNYSALYGDNLLFTYQLTVSK